MAFDFSQYPQAPITGGITGTPSVDPSQLQVQPTGVSLQNPAPTSPMLPQNAPTTGTPAAAGSDPWAYFDSIFPGPSLSPQDLLAHEADLKAHGITLIKNAAGLPGKVQLADGGAFDVIGGAGAGQNIKQRIPIGGGVNGSAGSTLGSLGYSFGSSMAPFTQNYALPTLDEFKASPFYGAGLDAYSRAQQNNAAAHGTLLNGRFQEQLGKNLLDYGLTQYGQYAGLNKGVFDTNRDIFYQNEDRPFQKNLSLAQLGKPG